MKTNDLYLFGTTNWEEVRRSVETALGIEFVAHDRYHYRDYYLFRTGGLMNEAFKLYQNVMFEGELLETDVPENAVLLSVVATSRRVSYSRK